MQNKQSPRGVISRAYGAFYVDSLHETMLRNQNSTEPPERIHTYHNRRGQGFVAFDDGRRRRGNIPGGQVLLEHGLMAFHAPALWLWSLRRHLRTSYTSF